MTYAKRKRDTSGVTAGKVVVALGVVMPASTLVVETDITNEITDENGSSLATET